MCTQYYLPFSQLIFHGHHGLRCIPKVKPIMTARVGILLKEKPAVANYAII